MRLVKLTFQPATPRVCRGKDIARMIAILNARGFRVPGPQLQMLWDEFSEFNACGWSILPESDHVLERILLGGLGVTALPDYPEFYFPRRWHRFYKG